MQIIRKNIFSSNTILLTLYLKTTFQFYLRNHDSKLYLKEILAYINEIH